MGSTPQERARLGEGLQIFLNNEWPRHRVMLMAGYWLADTPCTQRLWEAIMGENPSLFKEETDSAQRPVEKVSWDHVQRFLMALSKRLPVGYEVVLPTEAQWEYAARAGEESAYWWGDETDGGKANWNQEQRGTTAVKSYSASLWGLYDMHGNVWEWCAGSMRKYGEKEEIDPPDGQDEEKWGVLRGGSWRDLPSDARAAYRRRHLLFFPGSDVGFRFSLKCMSPVKEGNGAAESPGGAARGGRG